MNHLYFNVSLLVTIGNVQFDRVHSIVIHESVKKLANTATLEIPRAFSAAVVANKTTSLEKKNITDFIKKGDNVSIQLGYDGDLQEEFKGYVTRIGADAPLKIECEDEMYQLRQTTFTEVIENTSLLKLLKVIAPGYEYEVIDDIELGKYEIDNASAFEVLEDLRKKYGLYAHFKDQILVVGWPYEMKVTHKHEINLNRNVRAQSTDLEYVRKDDIKLLIKGISIHRNGKRFTKEYGDQGGSTRTLHFLNKTEAELDRLVEKNYKTLSFDGHQGTIPTWCYPRIKAGDAIALQDPNYDNSDRDGNYLIEGVKIKVNKTVGILRENKIGTKI